MLAPARWISTAGLLVDIGSLLANDRGGATMALMGRHEFDTAVAVPVVVPIHKGHDPLAGIISCQKDGWGIGPVFDGSEQGLRVGGVWSPWRVPNPLGR